MRTLVCFIALFDSLEYWVNVGHIRDAAFTDLAAATNQHKIPSSDIRYHKNKPAWCQWLTETVSPFIEARTASIPYSHSSGQISSTPFLLFSSPEMLKKGLDTFLEKIENSDSKILFTQLFNSIFSFAGNTYERYTHPKTEHALRYFYDDSHEHWDERSLAICALSGQGFLMYHPDIGEIRDIRGPFRWDNGIRITEDGHRHRINCGSMLGCVKFMLEVQTAGDQEERMVNCFLGLSIHYNARYKGASSHFHKLGVTQKIDTISPEIISKTLTLLKEKRDIDGYFQIRSTFNQKRKTHHWAIEITFPNIGGRSELCNACSAVAQAITRTLPWEFPDTITRLIHFDFEFAAKEADPNSSYGKIAAVHNRRRRLVEIEKITFWSAPGRHHIPPKNELVSIISRTKSKSCTW